MLRGLNEVNTHHAYCMKCFHDDEKVNLKFVKTDNGRKINKLTGFYLCPDCNEDWELQVLLGSDFDIRDFGILEKVCNIPPLEVFVLKWLSIKESLGDDFELRDYRKIKKEVGC